MLKCDILKARILAQIDPKLSTVILAKKFQKIFLKWALCARPPIFLLRIPSTRLVNSLKKLRRTRVIKKVN